LLRRDWAAVRGWLISLARELDRAAKDSTLPLSVGTDRIWIASDGTIRMSEFPMVPPGDAGGLLDATDAQRFLCRLAREALPNAAQSRLPLGARRVLERLERRSYQRLGDVVIALEAVPPVVGVSRGVRAGTAALAAIIPIVMLALAIVEVPKAVAVRRNPDLDHLDRIMSVYESERPGRLRTTNLLRMRTPMGPITEVLVSSRVPRFGLYSVGLGLNRWPAGGLGQFTDAQRLAFLTYVDSQVDAHESALMATLLPSYVVSRLRPRYPPSSRTVSHKDQTAAREAAAPVLAQIEAVAGRRRPFWLDHSLWIQVQVSTGHFLPALFGIGLAGLFRGAAMLRLFGYDIVGPDGRRATYLRAVWRSVVAWSPALVWLALLPPLLGSNLSPLTIALMGSAVNTIMIGGAIWSIKHPDDSIQDRVARTKIVPA
jgi:hypothetical protein